MRAWGVGVALVVWTATWLQLSISAVRSDEPHVKLPSLDDMRVADDNDDGYDETIAGVPLTRLKSVEDLNGFLDPPEVDFGGGVVGVFPGASVDSKAFEEFARPLDGNGYRFAISVGDPDVISKLGVKDTWKIFMFPPPKYVSQDHGDRARIRFGGKDILSESGKGSLRAFINEHYLPLVSRISPIVGNERLFVEQRLPVFVVISDFDEDRDPKGVSYILNRLRKIGTRFRGRMLFAILDSEDAESTLRFQSRFYIADEDAAEKAERIVGIKDGKMYYTLEDSFSVDNATRFVDNFFSKTLKPSTYQEDVVDDPTDEEINGMENLEL